MLEILKERLNLFYWNLIQLKFKICFRTVKIVKKMFILLLMSGMTSQEVWLFATDSQMFKQNSEQFTIAPPPAKLVVYECVPIKSYNNCIISQPVVMQVYKIEKVLESLAFKPWRCYLLLTLTLNRKCAIGDKTEFIFMFHYHTQYVTLCFEGF